MAGKIRIFISRAKSRDKTWKRKKKLSQRNISMKSWVQVDTLAHLSVDI